MSFRRTSFFSRAWTLLAGLLLVVAASQSLAANVSNYVVEISVDGLGSKYLQPLIEKNEAPNFKRFQTEGAWTNNARNDEDVTVTLPNHTTMITARNVKGDEGHHWTKNTDPKKGQTLQSNRGFYLCSVFDVAHDHGLKTALYTGKTKFSLFAVSYDATNGAEDVSQPSHGRNKIDSFVYDKNSSSLTSRFLTAMAEKPSQYTFVHYADPDAVGHKYGWGSEEYLDAICRIDGHLGKIFRLVATDPRLRGKTTIILTADHGGRYRDHSKNIDPAVYTIPFYAWGRGVAVGKDLYELNAATRKNPGEGHPLHTDAVQPIRNGDGVNLALKLLGLGPIPGSTINPRQDVAVDAVKP